MTHRPVDPMLRNPHWLIWVGIVILFSLTFLVSCGADSDSEEPDSIVQGKHGTAQLVYVNVEGRSMPCVMYDGFESGGITCDWQVLHDEEPF